MTDPVRNDSTVLFYNNDRPGLLANTGWDRFNDSPNEIREEIAEGEAMIRRYAGEIEADEGMIGRLIARFGEDLEGSGLSRDQVERYRSHLRAARNGISDGQDALADSIDTLRDVRRGFLDGHNRLDRAALEALSAVKPNNIRTPELQGEVDALEAANDPVHGAWIAHQEQLEQAAAGVLRARSRILAARTELARLENAGPAAEQLRDDLEEINKWIEEFNTDVEILQEWQDAVQHDRTHLAEKTGAISSEAASEVRDLQAQLIEAREAAAAAAAAHAAAESAKAEGFEPVPEQRDSY